jgi:hypothetical protein
MLFCFKIVIKSFRKAIESKVALGRCNIIVGGVLRIGSRVGVIVGINVGNNVGVEVGSVVHVGAGCMVGSVVSVLGIDATCAAGAQAEIRRM